MFRLAAWTPGSYRIRDYARNVLAVSARVGAEPLAVTQLDKQSWRCAPTGEPLSFSVELYAREDSVRGAYLDIDRGLFDGAGVYPRPDGYTERACRIELRPPEFESDWSVATAMQPETVDARGWGWYRVSGYAELIDQPVGMGHFERLEFDAAGVPHQMAVFGAQHFDAQRLRSDLKTLCTRHIGQMQAAPHDRYLFLLRVGAGGDGGLEHCHASTLAIGRDSLPRNGSAGRSYRRLLGLCSHEYFHLWNVKRIRPLQFAQSNLLSEAYSEDLWAYEGVTSYFDDWTLRQAGLLSVEQYLQALGESLTRLMATPGRLRQSLAQASHDAWIRLYQPSEHTPNSTVSYYLKGSLIALALDLGLRRQGAPDLLAVMRDLYQQYEAAAGAALPERALEATVVRLAGVSWRAFFERFVRTPAEPQWSELLAGMGLELHLRAAAGLDDLGGEGARDRLRCDAGLRLLPGRLQIAHVLPDGPAEHAGLQPGDELLALDGLRLDRELLERELRERDPGTDLELHLFRDDVLRVFKLRLAAAAQTTCELRMAATVDAATAARRAVWLGIEA